MDLYVKMTENTHKIICNYIYNINNLSYCWYAYPHLVSIPYACMYKLDCGADGIWFQ